MHKVRFSSLIIAFSIIISACQPTVPSQAPQSDGITDVHVNTAVPTENRVTSETFPLPNCGGTGEIHQTLGTTASITKSVTVSGKATVRGGGEADIPETVKLKLEIEIEAAYQKTYESANSRLDTISMPAAAGTHVIYEIGWYEQSFNSLVEYSSNGQVYEVPYTYTLHVPKIDNSSQVICPSTEITSTQNCAYTSNNDVETITKIIQAEAEAINTENISIIRDIFSPNATIRFQGDGTEWQDPVAHYLENFGNADVINAAHFNIQPTDQGISNNTASFISGSSGTIIFNDGHKLDYYNELGKDTWLLEKNSSGCWVIVEFTFY